MVTRRKILKHVLLSDGAGQYMYVCKYGVNALFPLPGAARWTVGDEVGHVYALNKVVGAGVCNRPLPVCLSFKQVMEKDNVSTQKRVDS